MVGMYVTIFYFAKMEYAQLCQVDKMGIGEFIKENVIIGTLLCAIAFTGGAYLTSRVVKNFNRPTVAYENRSSPIDGERVLYTRNGKIRYEYLNNVKFENGDTIYNDFDLVFDNYGNLVQHEKLYTEEDIQNTIRLLTKIFG